MSSIHESIKSLKVLNASAGSGKTYNLVKDYVKLLIEDPTDTKRFSKIIAMTFTNMASLEMKTRIVAALDILGNPTVFGEKAKNLGIQIAEELLIPLEEVHKRSAIVMKHMLHSYEDFSVMTIDKFNLRLIRSFSRDLDLPADFEVVLNENQVIEQVVDLLLSRMGTDELKDFTRTALNYAKVNLEDGEAWDFRRSLIEFGATFNKEKDQHYLERLVETDFSDEKLAEVRQRVKNIDDDFLKIAKELYALYSSYGMDSSNYPNASLTTKWITSMGEASGFNDKEIPKKTFEALSAETPKGKFFPDELRAKIIKLHSFQQESISLYSTLFAFIKNFYNMSLLKYIAGAIDEMKKDERIIRISEFNKLISTLVQQEEAPFIYERLGNRFHHFLLDEFQDTSRLQWLNMIPLVHESLSQSKFNLIVGDPKQSIYRFKNGVAEQFVALPGIYNPEHNPETERKSLYFKEMGFVEELQDNWRSSKEIVEFNNALFSNMRALLPEKAQSFYNSVLQHPKSDTPGIVRIKSKQFEKTEVPDVHTDILDIIEECISDGFKPSDICLLAETNKIANNWALALKQEGYTIISAESLLVDNDLKVNLTISYLKRRLKPSYKSEMKRFAELYYRCKETSSFEAYHGYVIRETNSEGKSYVYFDNDRFIIDNFGSTDSFFCRYENIYDLIQQFYRTMKWEELKNPYLHHLADFAYEFEQVKGPELAGFLDLYGEKKNSLAIQTPPSDDAIIVMTIHKSKGLEFPVVILPNCNFDIAIKTKSRFLLESDEYVLHTTLSAKSNIKEIGIVHKEESDNIVTDKMNLCYVGMTRPKDRLYGFNYFHEKGFGTLLHEGLSQLNQAEFEDDLVGINIGERATHIQKNTVSTNFYEPVDISDHLWFPDIAFSDRKKREQANELSEEQRFGNQFHLFMAELNEVNEIEQKANELLLTGQIEQSFFNRLILEAKQILTSEQFIRLFEHADEILNEQNIIAEADSLLRPDKIIVKSTETIVLDYKTGSSKSSHIKQMNSYISLLREMDYPNVKGYIYYTHNSNLQEVG